jgi:hypothetical protein
MSANFHHPIRPFAFALAALALAGCQPSQQQDGLPGTADHELEAARAIAGVLPPAEPAAVPLAGSAATAVAASR